MTKRIPFDKYKFSVITYETEIYYSSQEIKNESRRILKNYGYDETKKIHKTDLYNKMNY